MLDAIIYSLKDYIYLNFTKNSQHIPFHHQLKQDDLIRELETTKRECFNSSLDFFIDLKMLFNRVEDGHFKFQLGKDFIGFDFFSKIVYNLPMKFIIENQTVILKDQRGVQINVDSINGMDPFTFFDQWGDTHSKYKSKHCKFVDTIEFFNNDHYLFLDPVEQYYLKNGFQVESNGNKIHVVFVSYFKETISNIVNYV